MTFPWLLIMGLVYGLLIIIVTGLVVAHFAKSGGFWRKAGRPKNDDVDSSGRDGEDRGIYRGDD
jgi:hypothetical protein